MVEEGSTAWSLARILARHPNHPAVTLVTRELTDDDMTALRQRGDCFVSLCRSEGWGIGAFDAAACGNPVVTKGRYMTIWRKQPDGQWKVILDSSSEEPPNAGDCCKVP